MTKRTNPSWKILFRILFRKTFQSSKAGQYSTPGNTEKPQRYFLRRANPRHIIIRFTRVETKEKILRAARERSSYP